MRRVTSTQANSRKWMKFNFPWREILVMKNWSIEFRELLFFEKDNIMSNALTIRQRIDTHAAKRHLKEITK